MSTGGNPAPTITSVSPAMVAPGGTPFTLTVSGTNFIAASAVRWNGSSRMTSFVSATELRAEIPATDIAAPSTAQITVFNPPPGGGMSNEAPVAIAPFSAGILERVSVSTAGGQADNSSSRPAASADGRYVAFVSFATTLVPGDTNGLQDVFLRDTCLNAASGCMPSTVLVSVSAVGGPADGASDTPSISADGRFVAFLSGATNLVPGDTNGTEDVFVRDMCINAPAGCVASTSRVSVSTAGVQADGMSQFPWLSADGRFVSFQSLASNLVPGDTNGTEDVFVRDTCFGAAAGCMPSTTRVSISSTGTQGDADSAGAKISANGRFVVFESRATNLVPGDTNGVFDVFVRDTCFGAAAGCLPSTTRVSVSSSGVQGDDFSTGASISADGRYAAFDSAATNLVAGDTNGAQDIFVRDTCFGAPAGCAPSTIRVSVGAGGAQGNGASEGSSISAGGRFVAFLSGAANLVAGDTNGVPDVFVHDTCISGPAGCTPSTVRASVSSSGAQGDAQSGFIGFSLSANGRVVVFASSATNLVPGDTNGVDDIFLARTSF